DASICASRRLISGGEVKVLPYIRPVMQVIYLLALMKSAGRGLISTASLVDKSFPGFPFPGLTYDAINRLSACATLKL
ncbi:hypothetical protein, partial [Acidithiobacillus caldus]|uniref:hypothetical protein n=1 Tax=Acidithiobacillus caldus TaxID=33059 RepID=UPI001C064C3C